MSAAGSLAKAATQIGGALAKLPPGVVGPVSEVIAEIVEAIASDKDPKAAAQRALVAAAAKKAYRKGATEIAKRTR